VVLGKGYVWQVQQELSAVFEYTVNLAKGKQIVGYVLERRNREHRSHAVIRKWQPVFAKVECYFSTLMDVDIDETGNEGLASPDI
jgi:hypothetical protein